jgi:hypothetical protein
VRSNKRDRHESDARLQTWRRQFVTREIDRQHGSLLAIDWSAPVSEPRVEQLLPVGNQVFERHIVFIAILQMMSDRQFATYFRLILGPQVGRQDGQQK